MVQASSGIVSTCHLTQLHTVLPVVTLECILALLFLFTCVFCVVGLLGLSLNSRGRQQVHSGYMTAARQKTQSVLPRSMDSHA